MQRSADDTLSVCSGIPDLKLFFGKSGFNLEWEPGRRTAAPKRKPYSYFPRSQFLPNPPQGEACLPLNPGIRT
jgi:hypothetical protein